MQLHRPSIAKGLAILAAIAPLIGAKTASKSPPPVIESAVEARPLRYGVFQFTSYPVAWTAAQKSNRPILIFVSSPRCPQCTRMISQTFHAGHIQRVVGERFETVYVDGALQPKLTSQLRVRRYPTSIVVGPDNKVMDVIEGYVDPNTFSLRLKANLAQNGAERRQR